MDKYQQKNHSTFYDAKYFDWQKNVGEFGGWANSHKFKQSVISNMVVVDFGCGGGFLLNNLNCRRKIGIEPNSTAAKQIKDFGIEHYSSSTEAIHNLGEGIADLVISNNALEHTLNPLEEIKNLKHLLKPNGVIHFFVPCDSINYKYNPKDINHHLFSWSPQNLGNLFVEAGYTVKYSKPYIHKWPRSYRKIAVLGWPIFNMICRLYGHIERSWFQVEIKAMKN